MLDLLSAQASARLEAARSQLPFGFNVIGYASANLGQGVALRNTVGLLVHAGIPFCVIDVDAGGGRSGHDGSLRGRLHELGRPLPYGINLFQMNPPELKLLRTGAGRALGMEERMNVCVPFWELPKLPPSWIPELSAMDLLLAPSRFVHGVLDAQVGSVPLRYYPQWLAESPRSAPDRARWNLPAGRTVFLCSFDAASDFYRKNAGGAVLAFAQAFEGRDDRAMLVIKINNVRMNLETARHMETFAAEALRLRGVRVITEAMAYLDVQSLYASVDVYISLHRGEGLGLGMMECMALGKPVIATDWSGNMDFMDDSSACLVGHRKIEVTPESSYHAASEGIPQIWAQPNLDEAAAWMRKLADDADLRHDIGRRASEGIRRFLDISGRADAFEALRRYFGSTWKARSSWTPVASTPPAVLIQNREDMNLLPGGDTILARSIRDALTSIGTRSAISYDFGHDLRDADVVQLINISRTSDTLLQLRNARKRGRPTVLIPLYEDMDRYLVKATGVHLAYQYLIQKKQVLPPDQLIALATQVPLPSHPLDNDICRRFGIGDAGRQQEILSGCDYVVTSGQTETGLLRRRFGFAVPASEIHYGIDPVFSRADGALFRGRYGLNEFALCVGRIETRKNTWTLIEVFRGMPDKKLVLIGQFEDPALESLVRAYAPKNIVFLKNLPRDELVSAYAAARLHVLPSWYELPGLVSLEAAAAGCRVVTTSWGTAYDHFGDRVHYCEPDAPATIRKAILEAWDSSADPTLREYAMETFDWRRAARELARIYAGVLSSRASGRP